jgi:exosortase A
MSPVAIPYASVKSFEVPAPWRQALPALTLLLLWMLFLYRETGAAMVTIWARSETFTHAFLVPPIVLWLVWRQRRLIAMQTPVPTVGAFLLIAGVAFVWLLGDLVAVNAVTQLAFVTLLVLTVPTLLGWAVARLIVFPLGFLFFAVPIGEFLMPQFMEWTANFTVFALRLSGIPVYREGLQFVIPSGNWSVVEACSGVRYLIASLTVGTLFAYLNYQSNKRRILFVIVSIAVPVVANWMRAYLIVMLGHLSGNKLAAGVDHLIYGWLFFGVVIMLMFIIGARWAEPEPMPVRRGAGSLVSKPAVTLTRVWLTTIGFAALVSLPHMALWGLDRDEGGDAVSLSAPTTLAPGWQAVQPNVADFKPAFQTPSAEINHSYTSQGRVVGLYLGYYRHQNYSRKLVSSDNVLVVSQDPRWALVSSGRRVLNLDDKPVGVRTAELRGRVLAEKANEGRLLVWQMYWINGRVTASDYLAKAYGAFYRLLGRGDDSAVIIISTPKDQAGGGDAVLDSFLSTNYATINELLLKTPKNR